MKERDSLVSALAAALVLLLIAAVVAVVDVSTTESAGGGQNLTVTPVTPASPSTTAAPPSTSTTVPPPPAPSPPTVWPVGEVSFPFVDRSRPAGPAGGDPGEAFRSLPTVVRYPALGQPAGAEMPGAAADRTHGPFPLIVFAHGYDVTPATYSSLLHAWAAAGYVVAAPAFPRATAGGPLDEGDLVHQAADVSFVIGQLLALARPGRALAGLIDATRVAVAGHSDGASTAVGVGYGTCCHDPRVLADLVMEGDEQTFAIGRPPGALPALLVVQGDSDTINPTQYGLQVFTDGPAPKFLLWLLHGQHLEPFTTDQAHLAVVEATTVAFFDRYLKNNANGVDRMHAAATAGLATLRSG